MAKVPSPKDSKTALKAGAVGSLAMKQECKAATLLPHSRSFALTLQSVALDCGSRAAAFPRQVSTRQTWPVALAKHGG